MHAFIFCLLFLSSLSTTSNAEAIKSFSIDLIHRNSPLSPFYNSSLTPSQLIKNAAVRSLSRSNRVGLSNKLFETIVIPDEGLSEYLMRFYIGTPPVERFAIADTGSDLIWLQCSPCKQCTPQKPPLFNPKKSSTFRSVSCDSQPCTLLPKYNRHCGNSGAKVRVNPIGLFALVEDNFFCMLVHPTSEYGTPIFGNMAQVGYQVEYDLKGAKVSFAPADCTKP